MLKVSAQQLEALGCRIIKEDSTRYPGCLDCDFINLNHKCMAHNLSTEGGITVEMPCGGKGAIKAADYGIAARKWLTDTVRTMSNMKKAHG